jgi:transposase-like protein
MTIKEKLQLCVDNGIPISFIARQMNVDPSTLSKWLRGEKGITHKNEALVLTTLQQIINLYIQILEG